MRVMLCAALLAAVGCRASLDLDAYGFDECSEDPCGIMSQCGCAADEGCYYQPGLNECAKAGDKPHGAPCQDNSECAPGTSCLEIKEGTFCLRYCETDDDCGGALGRSRCALEIEDELLDESQRWCSIACDPMDEAAAGCANPAGAAPLYACAVFYERRAPEEQTESEYATHCRHVGPAEIGDRCDPFDPDPTDAAEPVRCGIGAVCVPDGDSATCAKYCRLGTEFDDCDEGHTCEDILKYSLDARGELVEMRPSPYGACLEDRS